MALDAWQDGTIDGWADFQTGDFAYVLTNSCDSASPSTDLVPTTVSEDLGAESSETDTFLPYTPIVFADQGPSPVAGTNGNGCRLLYSLIGPQNEFVRSFLSEHVIVLSSTERH